ncbi:MAG: CaiB/BaiF CoA transferase family protein [Bacteroidia bacterium]
MKKIFKDLKVVELASVLAGPSTALFFAELGADVLKIENKKTGGDITRSWKLPEEDKTSATSAYFHSVNFGKKHLFLDLSDKTDKKLCLEKLKKADIVIVNYKKGDDRKLGMDYATLKKLNPKLIYAQIFGFGPTDERVAFDLILQAESGFMSINGTPESGPLKMPVALIDLLAAHLLKEAILLALLSRSKTKKGAYVSVSLFDAAVSSLVNQVSNWLIAGHLPLRTGSLHPNIAPYGEILETKDKQLITFAIGSDKQFDRLCRLLGLSDLVKDKRFATNQLRVQNRSVLFDLLQTNVKEFEHEKLLQKCTKEQVPCGKIRNIEEVMKLAAAKPLIRKTKDKKKVITSIPFTTSF